MKPQFIRMKAFGSYREERIDFSDVQQGLFLITGDTGAGKTTIFDAIMFALFGETSGGKRDGKMMRSQYAPEDMVTEVEFGFSYRGELYVIKRRPQQPRYKKNRQTGVFEELKTQMPAKAELIMPDGKEFPGKIAQINEKLIQIIGLNASQFTQVAMLAQGDFVKLLHASSKDRKEIFSKMFDTRIYGYIQEELKQEYTLKAKELSGNRRDIVRELREVSLIDGSRYEEIWNSDPYLDRNGEHFCESDAEGLLELIGKIGKEAQEKESKVQEERRENEKKRLRIQAILEDASFLNGQLDRLEERKGHQKMLVGQAREMEQLGKRIRTAQKAEQMMPSYQSMLEKDREVKENASQIAKLKQRIDMEEQQLLVLKRHTEKAALAYEKEAPGLQITIDRIEKSLDQYDAYEKLRKEKESAIKILEDEDKQIQRVEGQIRLCGEQIEALTEELRELNASVCSIEGLEAEQKEEQRLCDDLDEILDDLERLEQVERSIMTAEQSYKSAAEEAKKQTDVYQQCQQQFIANQALILRNQLKVGEPCPVCGKIHREEDRIVDKNLSEQTDVDEKLLKKLQLKKEKADQKVMERRSALDVERAGRESLIVNGQKKLKKVFQDADQFDLSRKQTVSRQSAAMKASIKSRGKVIQENIQKKEQIAVKETLLSEENQQKTNCEKTLQQKKERREEQDKKVGIYEAQIVMLSSQLAFRTKAEAETELQNCRERLRNLVHKKKECEVSFAEADKSYTAGCGELKRMEDYREQVREHSKRAEAMFADQLRLQGFADREEFEHSCIDRQELDAYIEQKRAYDEDVRETEIIIRELEISTKGKQRIDISGYKEEQQVLNEEQQRLEKAYSDLHFRVHNNKKVYDRTKILYKDRERLSGELLVLANLNDTANGKIVGKQRINFQTYMQRRFFKNIICHANQRLQTMSNGQFILQCRELQNLGSSNAEVGLDLDVYSLVNQQSRDVKTLSGGESFLAALSMALGMADIIQSSNGSIHIDTMFIDEGFGSLSEDTRDQAIAVLNELSGGKRLVGIISHVSELKSQVERQLVIQKTEKGSRHHWKL